MVLDPISSHPEAARGFHASDCAVCAAVDGNIPDYASTVLLDPHAVAPNAVAIAEAVGFCSAHGAAFMGMPSETILDRVAEATLRQIAELLGDRAGMEEKRRGLFFRVSHACPACAHVERHVSAALNRHAVRWRARKLDGFLCLPHFRALIGVSQLPDLVPWTAHEVAALASRVPDVDGVASDHIETAACLVAGRISEVRVGRAPGTNAGACPACDAMREAHDHWLSLATDSARVGADSPAVMPWCSQHIWECVNSGEPTLAVAAIRFALGRGIEDLQRGVAQLRDEEERARIERESVWYRRKSPAYLLGRRRKHVNSPVRCPACEWMSLAASRAIEEMLSGLEDRRTRRSIEAGPALCMKHFAEAYIVAPGGTVLEALMRMQTCRLRALAEAQAPWHEVIAFLSEPHQSFSVLQ